MNAMITRSPVVLSVVAHGLGFFLLHPARRVDPLRAPPVRVSFEVPKAVETPSPVPVAPAPVAPKPAAPVHPAPRSRSTVPPAPAVSPAAGPEPPAPLAGTTLAGEGASWSTVTNDGSGSMQGVVTPRTSSSVGPPTSTVPPAEEPIVPLADLKRGPGAPELGAALEREYPREARMQGISGSALLRVQIDQNGSVHVRRRISETPGGFGDACERALARARFVPALDRDGRPARTEISYRCRFEIKS